MTILKSILTSNRAKSLYWRTAMMLIAGVIALVTENLGLFALPASLTVLLGLILGEISKALNNALSAA